MTDHTRRPTEPAFSFLAAFFAFTLASMAQGPQPLGVPEPVPLPAPATIAETIAPVATPPPPPVEAPAPQPAAAQPAAPDTAAPPAATPTLSVTPPDKTAGMVVDQNAENPNLISIALDNVPLEDVVRLFTRISGANIIATTSNLQGTVTVNLKDVEWKPALTSILDMHGLTLQEKTPGTSIFSITAKPPGAPDPLYTETIFLKYASVSNAIGVIRPLLPATASLAPYSPANALVIRSTQASISDILKIVQKIDIPRQQVFIEAKFIELEDSAIEDLGVNWQVLSGFGISAKSLKVDFSDTKSRTDVDSQGVLGMQEKLYTQGRDLSDGRPVAGTDSGEEKITRQLLDSKLVGKNISDYKYDPETKAVTWTLKPAYESKLVRTAILSADEMKLVLSALKQTTGASVVSNPKIIVANEETALIHIGETERPFISTVTPGTQNSEPLVTYNPGDPVDLGVKVKVIPTINTEKFISVKIEPELTDRLEDAKAPNGQTYPIISTKKIQTIFSMESGKTAAIGGLTKTTVSDKTKKIPLLGDIPLIGKYLFSHTHKEKGQNETIIFVTVGLANPDSIDKKTGLPDNAYLVNKYLIQHAQEKSQQEKEILKLEEAQRKLEEGVPEEPKKGFFRQLFGK